MRRFPGWLSILALVLAGCSPGATEGPVTLRFWAMGREGEVVQELVRDFEQEHPGIQVTVQQIPWGAAHEKLLTAYVGKATPDIAQLGNTWISEFAALSALEPLDERLARSPAVPESAYFAGIWDTNVVDGVTWGIPWYVDTRVLFYRRDLLAKAGFDSIPGSWSEWRRAMEGMVRAGGKTAIFLPTNEYTPWIILGLQAGSPLVRDNATHGAFSHPEYRRALDFTLGIFRDGLAPALTGNSIANRYQEFERGTFGMYISGPWDVGEFRRRLSPEMQSSWGTAPLPGPDGPASGVSVAGGSSLVLFRGSRHADEAWKLIEYLSEPAQQLRFHRLTGDLPARREAWRDTAFTNDPYSRAFAVQLDRVVATPKIPEWEEISMKLQHAMEAAILGGAPPDSVMRGLDAQVERILEKRRWLLSRRAGSS